MSETIKTPERLQQVMAELVNAWCDRRCLRALRHALQGWPMTSGLTDDWAQFRDGLKDVRAFAKAELTEPEQKTVDSLIAGIDYLISRPR